MSLASLSLSGIPGHMKQDHRRYFYYDGAVSHLPCQVFNLLPQLGSHISGVLCPFYKRLIFLCLLSENCWVSQVLAVVVPANFSVLKVAYAMAEQRCVTHPVLL